MRSTGHNVVYCVHDAYAGPTAVSATSILANSPADFHFWILDLGLTDRSCQQLADVIGADRITFLRLADTMSLDGLALSSAVHAKRLGAEMYAKLYLPELLLGRCDRFLYLDCDTLVTGNLAPLFDTAMEEFVVGGALCFHHPRADSPEGIPDWEALGLDPGTPCLDTGMLLVDTQRFHERGFSAGALRYGRSHESLVLGDLTALNAVLRGEWFHLGYEWNFQVYEPLRMTYSGPVPVVHHFSGRHKPFLAGSKFPDMQIMYDEYRRICTVAGGPAFPERPVREGGDDVN